MKTVGNADVPTVNAARLKTARVDMTAAEANLQEEAKTEKTSESTALMVVEERNRALAKKLIYSDSKIRRTYSSTAIDSGSYQSGRAFGKGLNIPERIRVKLIGN